MNYATIKPRDIANGDGVRVSLFVSGCEHKCKGCFNTEAWSFDYGQAFTNETIEYILEMLTPDYIQGLTLLGGEPLAKQNISTVLSLVNIVKDKYPDKTIWCYTGDILNRASFTLVRGLTDDDMYHNQKANLLSQCDIIVDGPFIEELKDISLKFKGSANQRIIDVKETLLSNNIVLRA